VGQYQVSPSVLYVNSQQLRNITDKVLSGAGSSPLLQIFKSIRSGLRPRRWRHDRLVLQPVPARRRPAHPGQDPPEPSARHDPRLGREPAGAVQSNEVPNVAEVKTRQDYYQIDWPITTRQRQVGVYAEEVLAVYAPFAMGVITNIANG
jgi:hypothetical protein